MTEADLRFATFLSETTGWNQTPADWRRLQAHDPNGCFVAELKGTPVGTVTTTRYGSKLGWIGMLLVHSEFRRRGIGRQLLQKAIEHLKASGVACVKLDATPAGQPLYEELGFKKEWRLARWERGQGRMDANERMGGEPERAIRCRPMSPADFGPIVQLDGKALGVTRRGWLNALCNSARVLVAEEAGQVHGFGILREGCRAAYFGPLVAISVEAASAIAAEALGNGKLYQSVYWDVPASNGEAEELASAYGFHIQRSLVRMFLGANVASKAGILYAILGPEVG